MEQWIKELENTDKHYPREAIRALAQEQEQATPLLLNLFERVTKHPEQYEKQFSYNGHIYASFLLAEFREKSFLPLFLKFLSLPSGQLNNLTADFVTEYAGQIIASIADETSFGQIKPFIANDEADPYARGAALKALEILTVNGQLDRLEVLDYMRTLLQHPWKKNRIEFVTEVVASIDDLYPEELMPDIKNAYRDGIVDEYAIHFEDLSRTVKRPKEAILEQTKHDHHHQLIQNAAEDASYIEKLWQQPFYTAPVQIQPTATKSAPKVGRNDPCPCGSGKKYKKCCG